MNRRSESETSARRPTPEERSGNALHPEADAPQQLPRAPVLGTQVTVSGFDQAQDFLASLVERPRGAYISCANAYSVTLAQEDAAYQAVLNGADFVSADGMSVVWALRILGHRAERVHNDDLFLACCAKRRPWRHFLVGGRAGQPEAVAGELRQRFPGIEVVGTRATPVRPVPEPDNEAIFEDIRRTRPSIVWVGMGTPAQDHWMRSASTLGVPMVGVGSLFDLLSGRTLPAPDWVKRSGLQWAFRLLQEPRRLAWRYVFHNTRFIMGFARQWARQTGQR